MAAGKTALAAVDPEVAAVGSLAPSGGKSGKGAKKPDPTSFQPTVKDTGGKARIGPQVKGGKLLLAEFTVCFVVLGLGTVVAPQGSKDGVPRLISRGSGLCLLFFILALLGSAGAGSRRAANGLGGLVTVAYLVGSTDAKNVLSWITGFYSTGGVSPTSASYSPAAQAGDLVGSAATTVADQESTSDLGGAVAAGISGAAE